MARGAPVVQIFTYERQSDHLYAVLLGGQPFQSCSTRKSAEDMVRTLNHGAAAERVRIRGRLLEWADDFMRRGAYLDSFLEVLNSIAPEEG